MNYIREPLSPLRYFLGDLLGPIQGQSVMRSPKGSYARSFLTDNVNFSNFSNKVAEKQRRMMTGMASQDLRYDSTHRKQDEMCWNMFYLENPMGLGYMPNTAILTLIKTCFLPNSYVNLMFSGEVNTMFIPRLHTCLSPEVSENSPTNKYIPASVFVWPVS